MNSYKARQFNLSNLKGISDETLEMHFKLYEGYVKETNKLNEKISEFVKDGKVDQDEFAEYSELNRRLGFEYNGMVLHEYYFDNLKDGRRHRRSEQHVRVSQVQPNRVLAAMTFGKPSSSASARCAELAGPSVIRIRANGALSNHWITLHETGNVAGFTPVLVMDVWEHAFILDYKPADRPKYIEAFFSNIDWKVLEQRLQHQKAAADRGVSYASAQQSAAVKPLWIIRSIVPILQQGLRPCCFLR